MKKQQPSQISNEKLGLKSETLRRMSESLTREQLQDVVGGRGCTGATATSSQPHG